MSQFFESIRVKDGVVENLNFHQLRVNKTLESFDTSANNIALNTIIQQMQLPDLGLFKLKVSYDLHGKYQTECLPYQYKTVTDFALVNIKGHRYDYKYANRAWITEALTQSGRDEIIMHDDGLIKDCSYTNIVFFDGVNWYTPESPLLEGTQRAKLIKEGVVQFKALHVKDLPGFKKFRCINAMIDWENAIDYDITSIT